jgi:hypothetical protein
MPNFDLNLIFMFFPFIENLFVISLENSLVQKFKLNYNVLHSNLP